MDELLLRRAQNNDPEAFETLLTPLESKIWRICYHYMGERESASDCAQDTMLRIWRSLSSYRGDCAFETWVYRVALNTCISLDRKKRRSAEVRLTMDINLFEDRDEDTRQVDMLHKRISKLQPFDRAIVLLWLENLSYEEIGQIVGISTKNVSVRLFRIREQLKQMSND